MVKIRTGNGNTLTVKSEETFRKIPVGSMFVVSQDKSEHPCIWVKTPFADMDEHNNPVNQNGAFCNAICINAGSENLYMQCWPEAVCFVIDTDELFGRREPA